MGLLVDIRKYNIDNVINDLVLHEKRLVGLKEGKRFGSHANSSTLYYIVKHKGLLDIEKYVRVHSQLVNAKG